VDADGDAQTGPSAAPRTPLRRERVLRAAVDLAGTGGVEALSMRRLAQELGVEAMSLYRHVRNKGDLVDGMVDHASPSRSRRRRRPGRIGGR
jgi:AcrR family transcriptional regulator